MGLRRRILILGVIVRIRRNIWKVIFKVPGTEYALCDALFFYHYYWLQVVLTACCGRL